MDGGAYKAHDFDSRRQASHPAFQNWSSITTFPHYVANKSHLHGCKLDHFKGDKGDAFGK